MTTASIALCTYNGAAYLPEQLESIVRQARPPDEMVVCDDGSTDDTVALLESFREHAGFPVHIHSNIERLGSTKNFEQAIGLCTGDIIFLSDQDDIWHREKLALSIARLDEHAEYGAVFGNAELIDERGFAMGRFLWETLGFGEERRQMFREGRAIEILLEGNVVTGATMGFRTPFREVILPIPTGWVQDAWIALVIGSLSELGLVLDPVVRYRIHAAQQIGVPFPASGPGPLTARAQLALQRAQLLRRMRTNERDALRVQAARFDELAGRLSEHAARFPPKLGVLDDLEGKARHYEVRGRMAAESRRWPLVVSELRAGRYRRYSSGLPAAIKDLFLLDRGSPSVVLEDAWARTETPTIIFLQMPGTGGELIGAFLRRTFGPGALKTSRGSAEGSAGGSDRAYGSGRGDSRARTIRDANLELLPGMSAAQLRRFRALLGPFWFGVHSFLEPQPWLYVTLLRHPVDRVLSLYQDDVRCGSSLTLEEWLERAGRIVRNEQTRRLAPPGGNDVDVLSAPCTGEMLERAKLNLTSHFAAVGVAERFDESLVLIAMALGIPNPSYDRGSLPGAKARRQFPEGALRRIEQMNECDLELHRFAMERLETKVRLDGASIERAVARLRRRNEARWKWRDLRLSRSPSRG